jgi:hypothetical protein
VALTAVERGRDDAFISAHFEQAQRPGPAYEYAFAAAGQAASRSSHGEALELFGRAVRNLPAHLPPLDRAKLFARWATKRLPPMTTRRLRRRTGQRMNWPPAPATVNAVAAAATPTC